mgnify:CR=1 FL=1
MITKSLHLRRILLLAFLVVSGAPAFAAPSTPGAKPAPRPFVPAKVDPPPKLSRACEGDSDCPSGKTCKNNVCKKKPGGDDKGGDGDGSPPCTQGQANCKCNTGSDGKKHCEQQQ